MRKSISVHILPVVFFIEIFLLEHLWIVTNRQPRQCFNFHGCPAHCKQDNTRELFEKTQQQEQQNEKAGCSLVVVWDCEAATLSHYKPRALVQETEIYPHAIVYEFEAYLDKTKRYNQTAGLSYVSILPMPASSIHCLSLSVC